MSPKTYVGPFGRILPIPESGQPDNHHFACDETRTTLAYTLPPPPALQFGSDTLLDPIGQARLQRASQSARKNNPNETIYQQIARQANHDNLPSLNNLLDRKQQPGTAYQSLQQNTSRSHPSFTHSMDEGGSIGNNNIPVSYPSHQSEFPSSQMHGRSIDWTHERRNHSVQGEEYQRNRPTQRIPASPFVAQEGVRTQPAYPTPNLPYTNEPQQPASPGVFHPQPAMNVLSVPNQQTFATKGPVHYFADSETYTDASIRGKMRSSQGGKSTGNVVKAPIAKRVVAEADVPGEGPCWVYEDGTTCKKSIDGEPVNAQWGVTKAGKPRKRLAIACTTCREKKIKCDPAEPKCIQCEKFGRDCRFATALRNHQSTSGSPSYDSQARASSVKATAESYGGRKLLPSLSASSKAETSKIPALSSLPSLTSASSVEEGQSLNIKRRHSSPQIKVAKSFGTADSSPNQPDIKRQRCDPASPITSISEEGLAVPKTHKDVEESRQPLAKWLRKVPPAVKVHSVDWSEDPYEIDAKATSNIIYHATLIKLNRYVSSREEAPKHIARKANAALEHSCQLLHTVQITNRDFIKRSKLYSINSTEACSLDHVFATPFACFAILVAVDVLSAIGRLELLHERLELMRCGLEVVERQHDRWPQARICSGIMHKRIAILSETAHSKAAYSKTAWKFSEPMETSFGTRDIFYTPEDFAGHTLFAHLGIDVNDDEVIIVGGTAEFKENKNTA